MRRISLGMAACGLSLIAHNAGATSVTLDFNQATNSVWVVLDATGVNAPVHEDGFVVTAAPGTNRILLNGPYDNCWPNCASNGTSALMAHSSTAVRVAREDASRFSFFGFDGAETWVGLPGMWAQSIRVSGEKADHSLVQEDFQLDFLNDGMPGGITDFQSFATNGLFTDLISLTFSGLGGGGSFYIDNFQLSYTSPPAPATVAEPTEAGLLTLSLAALGLGLRRRRA